MADDHHDIVGVGVDAFESARVTGSVASIPMSLGFRDLDTYERDIWQGTLGDRSRIRTTRKFSVPSGITLWVLQSDRE
jgi:hypothetical protein